MSSELPATAALLKVLADENRLRILLLLQGGEACVCHLTDALGLGQPNVSQHLAVLKHAGLVSGERRGSWMWYRLLPQDPPRDAVLRAVLASLPSPASDDAAQKERPCC